MIDGLRRSGPLTAGPRLWWAIAAILLLSAFFGFFAHPVWLGLIVGAIVAIAIAMRPTWGLLGMVVAALLVPLQFSTGTEVKINTVTLLTPALMGVWLLYALRTQNLHLAPSRANRPLWLFLLCGLFSLLVGIVYWDPSVPRPAHFTIVQLAQWAIFAFSAGAFWLTGNLVHEEVWLRRLTYLFLAIAGSLAILLLAPGGFTLAGRIATFALFRAPFWLLLTALAGGQLLFRRGMAIGWRLFLLASLFAALVYAFGLQRERVSNMMAVSATLVALIALRWPRLRWPFIILIVIGLIVFFPTLYQFAGGDAKWEESGGSRLVLIQRVVELTMRNPVTGLGPAAYRQYGKTQSLSYAGAYYSSIWLSSHNNYVDLFSHTGLFGLGLFLWFALEMIGVGWRLRARYTEGFAASYVNAMLAAWVGALAIMLLADWVLPFVYNIGFLGFQASVLLWLFLGGLVALEQMGNKGPVKQG